MLGSAAQNIIALMDSVFLFYLSEDDFAAIGFVGVFYLMVAAIGYGFSRGGQILIARKLGERNLHEIGKAFRAMFVFELVLALLLFLFMKLGARPFFTLMVNSPIILEKSMEYLEFRSWGVFFSYAGVAIVGLYTGVARTKFIIADTVVLALVNALLCYLLIFGHAGFPAMGIMGAGLASTIAEVVAFAVFVGYLFLDKKAKAYKIFEFGKIQWSLVRLQYQLSAPIIAQMFIGVGSWFAFFSIVENLGERQLAVTNLVRMVYLILSIPTWGFSSGINTMVSGFIGAQKRQAVIPLTYKTARFCWAITMLLAAPVVFFPTVFLYPLLGKSDMTLIVDAQPIFYILLAILTVFSIGGVIFNGLAGTGATFFGLKLQGLSVLFYLAYVYLVIEILHLGLGWAWAAEIFYWTLMLVVAMWYLHSGRWHFLKIWR
jgi:putative MATE family efflux protein